MNICNCKMFVEKVLQYHKDKGSCLEHQHVWLWWNDFYVIKLAICERLPWECKWGPNHHSKSFNKDIPRCYSTYTRAILSWLSVPWPPCQSINILVWCGYWSQESSGWLSVRVSYVAQSEIGILKYADTSQLTTAGIFLEYSDHQPEE